MIKRMLLVLAVVAGLGIAATSVAQAGPPPVYRSYQECQAAGQNQVAVAGGPGNLAYQCTEIYGLPSGTPPCPPNAGSGGCIGDFWQLETFAP